MDLSYSHHARLAWPGGLFAQNVLESEEFLLAAAALALAILLGAAVVWWAERYKARQQSERSHHPELTSLQDYREMLDRGEISQDEYDRIRDTLAARARVPALSPPPPSPPPSDVPSGNPP